MSSQRVRPADDPTVQRISGPAELVQAVPYLLGFHPRQSLVLVGLRESRLVVTARVDLADAGPALRHTVCAIARGGAREVFVAVYDDRCDPAIPGVELPWADVTHTAADEIEFAQCRVLDVVLVGETRWWSYLCADPQCCPPEGSALPAAPSAFAASAAYSGIVALPDRAALEAQFDPVPDRETLADPLAAAERCFATDVASGAASRVQRSGTRALFAAARRSDAVGWAPPEFETVVRFGVALRSQDVRDAVWLALDDLRLDGRPLWRELARRLPPPYAAAPLFLFAWRSFRSGDGAVARIAAERALLADPGYSAADLLLAALARGVDPRRLPRLHRPKRSGQADA